MYIKVAGAKGHEYVYVCRNYRENGKIKGVGKGTCTVYVYAINGKMKKATVTVK